MLKCARCYLHFPSTSIILLLLPPSQFLPFIGIEIQKQALSLQQTLTADPHNRLLTADHSSTTCVTQSTTSAAAAGDSPSTSRLHNARRSCVWTNDSVRILRRPVLWVSRSILTVCAKRPKVLPSSFARPPSQMYTVAALSASS
jgi:hypothetical protein